MKKTNMLLRPAFYLSCLFAFMLLGTVSCSNNETDADEDIDILMPEEENADTDEEIVDDEVEEGDTSMEEGTALIPADLMVNCDQWKITYPDGEEDKTLCDEDNNEYFFVNDDKNGIVFKAPIRSNNGTTPNSSYIRSELRERTEDGDSDIYWTTEGTHIVYAKQAITHLPINKDDLVATQIHGDKEAGIDDSMVLRLEGSHLFLSFNGGQLREDVTISTSYTLGTIHEVIFEVIDDKHYCYYSEDGTLKDKFDAGTASDYLVEADGSTVLMDLAYEDSYFKIGNYTQSNAEREGDDTDDENNYGEVVVYDFYATHD
ncbi:polysaccharide lyase family 7 protein [Cellulophaga baltica]|uniref:polysaccharide lyase family 7 protein n=1 Tax=Cellulophaga TaxID=104264 RepID=UPI001C07CD98|nr:MULTISPECIES: polysaccharide lyase family 7 protein [Cellulophaga]MBU2994832.1 polysaccharide lyase family 7 protein [Cellulophaga baltica]MDO6766227.1 polysaccharide lyase family 7 protein [Cellulophaga sp. 1_MG-2023]